MIEPNPLLAAWTLPFGLPPFAAIRPEHFAQAFRAAMAAETAEYAAITESPAPPDFENTIAALERSGRLMRLIGNVFGVFESSISTPAIEAVALELAPELARHDAELRNDRRLFDRIAALYDAPGTDLTAEQSRLIGKYYIAFVRSGAKLDDAGKQRLSAIAQRLATLQTVFGQNVLHDEENWHLPLGPGDVAGLPQFLLDATAATARSLKSEAPYAVTLSRSSVEPFLTFSARADLRQQAWEAFTTRGEHPGLHDNRPLIGEILALRAEQGRLLGFATYADFSLDNTMAKTVDAANAQLKPIWEGAKRKALAERAMLEAAQRAEGANTTLEPWDWRYYAEKVRKAEFDLDEAEIKPYFVLANVIQAAFDTAGKLFGLSFTPRPDLPTYHPDVRAYEVTENGGQPVGLFLQDNFARPGKHSGAWMSGLCGYESFDEIVRPVVMNNNNFVQSEPTLLSFDDARTLFHEFGHALHALLNCSAYPTLAHVRWDYVEFPSQVYEHWIAAPETLRGYARHHATGEAMPEALLQRLTQAAAWNEGFHTAEAASAAMLDMALHTHPDPAGIDIAAYERDFLARIGMPREIGLRHRPAHFQHLFTGSAYAAGYYSYLWAAVLDADAFAAFREAGDIFDPTLATRLKAMYALGDTVDPMDLFIRFRGRQPQAEALLKQKGFAAV